MSVLLVDDDETLLGVMARAFERRGFHTLTATTAEEALQVGTEAAISRAVVDLRLGDDSGLTLIGPLLAANPALQIVVLTGYASIATAVKAIKLGAHHYLTKPTDVDEIIRSFGEDALPGATPEPRPTSLGRAEWEYIHQTLQACDGNVSAAAKRLGLHRRTLQRKLQKRPSGLD